MTQHATSSSKARTAVLALLTLLACGWAFASASYDEQAQGTPLQAPELVVPSVRCPTVGDAHERARDAETAAQARIARYPFAAAEGRAALHDFALAATCFAHAHDAVAVDRVQAATREWHATLQRDYRGTRVRLERALHEGDEPRARSEAQTLLTLLDGVQTPYTRRLRAIAETQPQTPGDEP